MRDYGVRRVVVLLVLSAILGVATSASAFSLLTEEDNTVLPYAGAWFVRDSTACRDEDGDGFQDCAGDCNDNDPEINPAAIELPGNATDENCDGDLGRCSPIFLWMTHGQYVRCVAQEAERLTNDGYLSEQEADALVNFAAQSDIGKNLNATPPLVVAHRGASGYFPEETLEAYIKAIDLGADVIEFDLVSTKDGVLIARHDPNLATSTDVASHPEFADRKKTTQVDGETQTGWFASDFTLAEIKTLGAIATDSERPQQYNGLYKIVTFQEIIDLVKAKSAAAGRAIALYPETKNPTYHRDLGLPLEDKLIDLVTRAGLNSKTAQVYVQSFEPGSLKYMKSKGLRTRLIQLIDAAEVDLTTGDLILAAPFDKPYDWAMAGDTRLFSDMVTPTGLAEIKTYADGIGPWKRYIVTIMGSLDAAGDLMDINGDGTINDADANSQPPTTLVADAHEAGLLVHPYTFRNEQRRLAHDYQGDPLNEYLAFYRLGVDGVFSDFTDTAIAARSAYLKELGR